MLLNDIIKIIELTDTDHLAKALDTFNSQGVVHSNQLPFLDVVYEKAENQLLNKLSSIGFNGDIELAQTENGDYVIFNAAQSTAEQVNTEIDSRPPLTSIETNSLEMAL